MNDKNVNYLFLEVTAKGPYLTEMERLTAKRAETAERMRALAKTFHKKAMPLLRNDSHSITMPGIYIESKADLKIPGWRREKRWGDGCYAPRMNMNLGKDAAREMRTLGATRMSAKLAAMVQADFGKHATDHRFAGGYVFQWQWGSYGTVKGKLRFVLQIMRNKTSEKKRTPRGLKKVKWSRVVALQEEGQEKSAA